MKRCLSCFKEFDDSLIVCPHCSHLEITKPKEPIHLIPGTLLADRYIIGECVGSGGFGIVYKAWDSKLETVVAVKEFFVSRLMNRAEGAKSLIVAPKSQTEFEYRRKRFLAEARNMAKFGAHKCIPNVFEFFEENNTAYIVMEFLCGMPLNEYLLMTGKKVDVNFAVMIVNEVGKALKSLHEKNIVHRDVAPDNIYICSGKDIRIKLTDFGAAKLADDTDKVIDIILKPGYSPVEQYDNSKNIGPWTDIYALGATLYMILTGVKPEESTDRRVNDTVVPPDTLNPLISENLSNTIMKAMAVEKHMRFRNISEFLSALNGERKIVTLAKERKRRNTKRFAGIAAAFLMLIAGAGIVYKIYENKKVGEYLNPADITVWFSVAEGSTEEDAIRSMIEDFTGTFDGVSVTYRAIPESEYAGELSDAAKSGKLPDLFESTDVSHEILSLAADADNVINSNQFKNALFLEQYGSYYNTKKQIPLAIEVPVAFVVTKGAEYIDYDGEYFSALSDFDYDNIAVDEKYKSLAEENYGLTNPDVGREAFFDNKNNSSAVLLSSTMAINEVRTTLTNYEKIYVWPNMDKIICRYTYEWSLGNGSKDEMAAAEKLLEWMLGNVYQSMLMINKCSDGQIPVNKICFDTKTESKNLVPIREIYGKFVFKGDEQ